MNKFPKKDSALLRVVDGLLTAGFSSPHRSVVNECITFWNSTFGTEEALEYPLELEKVLRARAMEAEVVLPTLSSLEGDDVATMILPAFYDSQSQNASHHNLSEKLRYEPSTAGLLRASQPPARGTHLATSKSPVRPRTSYSSPVQKIARRPASLTPKPRLRHDDSQIQFAPIHSSPLPVADESQLMTEHQKEVKSRQHENAQLFPDFSSSPLAQSTALPRTVSKRLDFTSGQQQGKVSDEQKNTPRAQPNDTGLMSDDLPSSPTPSSTKDVNQEPIEDINDEEDDDDDVEDLPSSPPGNGKVKVIKQADQAGQVDNVHVTDFVVAPQPTASTESTDRDVVPGESGDETTEVLQAGYLASDLPSDTELPTIQLHQEEEAASAPQNTQSPAGQVRTSADTETEQRQDLDRSSPSLRAHDEVTRINDSFAQPNQEAQTQSVAGSQASASHSKSRKRKRSEATVSPPSKRKQQSPFKRFTEYLWGQSQQHEVEDDDDIGEEIVVASSQRLPSPASRVPRSNALDSSSAAGGPKLQDEGTQMSKQGSQRTERRSSKKRGQNRSKKSQPAGSSHEPAVPNTLKRKASTLSDARSSSEQAASGIVKATPAPKKANRNHRTGAADHAIVRATNGSKDGGRVKRRTATAVLIGSDEALNFGADQDETAMNEDAQGGEADVESPDQARTAVQTRPIATPRSILARLRDALADFGGLILGSQEERQFDDVLFELRREVHDAGRRGREQDA